MGKLAHHWFVVGDRLATLSLPSRIALAGNVDLVCDRVGYIAAVLDPVVLQLAPRPPTVLLGRSVLRHEWVRSVESGDDRDVRDRANRLVFVPIIGDDIAQLSTMCGVVRPNNRLFGRQI